jgi:two-component system cell cycle sensor histidine kinase/response regulator CckA
MEKEYSQITPGKAEDRDMARVIIILILALCAMLLFLTAMAGARAEPLLMAVTGGGVVLQLVPFWLLKRGKITASVYSLMLLALAIIAVIATLGQGIRDIVLITIPIFYIFAGLTLKRITLAICVGMTLVVVAWLILGEGNGWFIPRAFSAVPDWADFIVIVGIFLFAAFTVDFLSSHIRRSLNEVRREIARRQETEAALRESETRFRTLNENSLSGIYIIDDGRYQYVNTAFATIFGYAREELIGAVALTVVHPDDRNRVTENIRRRLAGEIESLQYEVRALRKDGTVIHIQVLGTQADLDHRRVILGNVLDITAHRRAEEALRASEEKYRSLVDNAPVGISVTTAEGKRLETNRAMVAMHGYTREEYLNEEVISVYADPAVRQDFLEQLEKGPVQHYESRRVRKDGSIFWCSGISSYFKSGAGEKQIINIVQDISARKKASAENNLKALMLDAAGDMIYLHDQTGRILYANSAACKKHGHSSEEIIGLNIRDLLAPERRKNYEQRRYETFRDGGRRFETEHVSKDGTVVPVEVYNRTVIIDDELAIISVGRDTSERRKIEAQLMITDRLASLGELASGIAHEVNNPLTSVIGFAELLMEQPLSDDVKEDLTTIRTEAQRAAGVVRNFLTFARKNPPARRPVNLNDIIRKVLALRAYEQNISNIGVITRFAPDLEPVTADASQLQQVFFNIVTNAEYFMVEAHHKGTLTVTTENIAGFVRASVSDDGPGISADEMAYLFIPFFTTKPVGKGTGLGLSICHGIIASHDGRIYAESTPGGGATFIIELPIDGN